eukprot:4474613-Prymnesium_polylepis.1
MLSDLRGVVCGKWGHDIDCENGDFRLMLSLAEQLGYPVPLVREYVLRRHDWLKTVRSHPPQLAPPQPVELSTC